MGSPTSTTIRADVIAQVLARCADPSGRGARDDRNAQQGCWALEARLAIGVDLGRFAERGSRDAALPPRR